MYNMAVFNAVQRERGRGRLETTRLKVSLNGRVGIKCEHRQIICQLSHQNFRVCSWNVGTVRGRSNEVVEVMSRRKADIWGEWPSGLRRCD